MFSGFNVAIGAHSIYEEVVGFSPLVVGLIYFPVWILDGIPYVGDLDLFHYVSQNLGGISTHPLDPFPCSHTPIL